MCKRPSSSACWLDPKPPRGTYHRLRAGQSLHRSSTILEDIGILKQALPYLRKFKGALFVIKFGGEAMRTRENLWSLAEDIAFLHSVGIRLVIVHGGGRQVTDLEKRLGHESRFVGGRRVTDKETLEALKMVLGGSMNIELTACLRKFGVAALGISALSGGTVRVSRKAPMKVSGGGDEVVDFGEVGKVEGVDTKLLTNLLDGGFLPVISPLCADEDGNILNVNADVVSTRIAAAFKAEKLLLMSDKLGVMAEVDDPSTLISSLNASQAREAIAEGIIAGGMIPKVEESLLALEQGVRQVHIVSAVEPHMLLLEIFTESGCGTMLTS